MTTFEAVMVGVFIAVGALNAAFGGVAMVSGEDFGIFGIATAVLCAVFATGNLHRLRHVLALRRIGLRMERER